MSRPKFDKAIGKTIYTIVALWLVLTAAICAKAQEVSPVDAFTAPLPQHSRNVTWERRAIPIYRFKVTAEQEVQLKLREKIAKLIFLTYADEANGIHDVKKFREIKKLAAQLNE